MSKKTKDVKYSTSYSKHGWESGLTVIKSVKILVPYNLLLACEQIAAKVNGNEFSIITKIEKIEDGVIHLEDKFSIPPQRVTSTSIHYGPDDSGGNVVIHRHPDGMNSFSATDEEYINQNFVASLLFTRKDKFSFGIYNFKVGDDAIVQIPAKIEVILPDTIGEIDISNIEQGYTSTYNYGKSSSNFGYNYGPRSDEGKGGSWNSGGTSSGVKTVQFEDDEDFTDEYYYNYDPNDDEEEKTFPEEKKETEGVYDENYWDESIREQGDINTSDEKNKDYDKDKVGYLDKEFAEANSAAVESLKDKK